MENSVYFCIVFYSVFVLSALMHWSNGRSCIRIDPSMQVIDYFCDKFHGNLPKTCSWNASFYIPLQAFEVKQLNFRRCGADLLDVMKKYPNFTELDISYSNYKTLDWFNVEINRLVKLNASHNNIEQLPRGFFNKTPALTDFDLSYNKLGTINNFFFESAIKLRRIYLSHSGITHLFRDVFVNLTELEFIDLSDNEISDPNTIFRQSHFKVIRLENNPISVLYREDLPLTMDSMYFQWSNVRLFYLKAFKDSQIRFIPNSRLEGIFNTSNGYELHFNERSFQNVEVFDAEPNSTANIMDVIRYFGPTLRDLTITGNHIGKIPANAFRFINVNRLYLSETNLPEFHLDLIQFQEDLASLDISNNNLNYLGNASAVREFVKFSHLNLLGNQLKNTLDIVRYLRPQMRSLHLSDNFVGEINATTFGRFKNLLTLSLKNTSLSFSNIDPFDSLTNLASLNVSYNNLNNVHFEVIANTLKRLVSFRAAGCHITNAPELLKLIPPKIQSLDLSDIPFGEVNGNTLKPFSWLRYLYLRNASLTSYTIENQPSLSILDISNNNITELKLLTPPTETVFVYDLRLENNELTELHNFTRFKSLKTLSISRNRFPCEYLTKFLQQMKSERPNVRIIGDPWDQKHGDDCRRLATTEPTNYYQTTSEFSEIHTM